VIAAIVALQWMRLLLPLLDIHFKMPIMEGK
jgi:hypothetical protein